MAVLIADTLKPMARFPVAMASDIVFNDNLTTVQKWYDDFVGGQAPAGAQAKSVSVFTLLFKTRAGDTTGYDAQLFGTTYADIEQSLANGSPTMVVCHQVNIDMATVTEDNLDASTVTTVSVQILGVMAGKLSGSALVPVDNGLDKVIMSFSVAIADDDSVTLETDPSATETLLTWQVKVTGTLDAPAFGPASLLHDPLKLSPSYDLNADVADLYSLCSHSPVALVLTGADVAELTGLVLHPVKLKTDTADELFFVAFTTTDAGLMMRYSLHLKAGQAPSLTYSPISALGSYEMSIELADPDAQPTAGATLDLNITKGDFVGAKTALDAGLAVFLHFQGTVIVAGPGGQADSFTANYPLIMEERGLIMLGSYQFTIHKDITSTVRFSVSRIVPPVALTVKYDTATSKHKDFMSLNPFDPNARNPNFSDIRNAYVSGTTVSLFYQVDQQGAHSHLATNVGSAQHGTTLEFSATYLDGDDLVVSKITWNSNDQGTAPADFDPFTHEESRIPKDGVTVLQTIITGQETDAVSANAVAKYVAPYIQAETMMFEFNAGADGLPESLVSGRPSLGSGRTITAGILAKFLESSASVVQLGAPAGGVPTIPLFQYYLESSSSASYEGVFEKDGVTYTIRLTLDDAQFDGTQFDPAPVLTVTPQEVKSTALIISVYQDDRGGVTTTAAFSECIDSLQAEDVPACFLVTNAQGAQTVVPVTGFKPSTGQNDGEIQGYLVSFSGSHLGSVSLLFKEDGNLTLNASQSEVPELTTALTTTINADGSTCDEFYLAGTTTSPDFDTIYQSVSDGCPALVTATYEGHPSTLACVDAEDTVLVFSCSFVRANKVIVYTVTWTKDTSAVFSSTELDASGIAIDRTVTPGSQNAVSGDAVSQYVGELTSLATTAKDTVVNATNELKDEIDGIKDTLATFAIPIEIRSFSVTPNTTVYERGATIPQLNFAWTTSMEPDTQSLKKDGVLVPGTDAVATKDAQDTPAGPATYTLEVGLGGSRDTASFSIRVLDAVYFGSAAPGAHDEAFIEALSDSVLSDTSYGKYKVTVAQGEHAYIAYPKAFPAVTAAYIGGFKTELEMVVDTVQVTNAHGHTQDYSLVRTYRSGLGGLTMDVRED